MSAERHHLLVQESSRPMATVHVAMRTGTLQDPPEREGLAHFTGQMLMRGAGDLSQEQIAERLDYLGSHLNVSVDRTITSFTGDALSRNMDALQEIMSLSLLSPTFPDEEVERLKRQGLAELAQVRDHDSSLGYRFYSRRLFADHPYGRSGFGTEKSIQAITRAEMVAFYEENYTSSGALEAGCGDIDEGRLVVLGAATLGGLRDRPVVDVSMPDLEPREGWRALLVDKPERSQTQVFLGHPTVSARHPDHLALVVGNMVFGGTFTSRLSQEIREKRGWSYAVSSQVAANQHLGALTMRFSPAPEHTRDAIALAGDLFETVAREGVTQEEMEGARAHLINGHPLTMESPAKELHKRVANWVLGRSDVYVDQQLERFANLTREQVNAALSTHLRPDALELTVVCTADDIREDIAEIRRIQTLETIDYMEP